MKQGLESYVIAHLRELVSVVVSVFPSFPLTPCDTPVYHLSFLSASLPLSLPASTFILPHLLPHHVSFLLRSDPGLCQLLIEAINY